MDFKLILEVLEYKNTEAEETYLYEFTNSKFISFLATLEPKAYLVFVTLIALLVTEELNVTESKVVYAFIANIVDTMQTILEHEIILSNYRHAQEDKALQKTLQKDFETIYSELANIKKRLPN